MVLLLNILKGFVLECNICFLPNLIRKQTQRYLFPGGAAVKKLPTMQEIQEMGVPSLGQEDLLEKGMATHSSILVWRIPVDRGPWWATVHEVAESEMTE